MCGASFTKQPRPRPKSRDGSCCSFKISTHSKPACATRAGPKLREAERASLSRPVLARMHRALVRLKTQHRFLPQSLMGKAISYALNQWPSLHLFLEGGRIESERSGDSPPQAARRASAARQIDNNRIENATRVTRCVHPNGDHSVLLAPPAKDKRPVPLLHCPAPT
ncbi:MAG: transposase [Chthoniobacteraceae bacterium]